ncbi:hypothetical protein CEXT_289831 [Caerostris extrusa]|uniref:Uncharacterized protein n=1 Tax=Caerostris extrusa TaxID=172846 RepID=A0AAV4NB40_CAEEX|nr:hypothetical protein CEXT_289831 [Caerostris extrusa]
MNHFPLLVLEHDECTIANIRAFRFSESRFLLQEFQMRQIPGIAILFSGKRKGARRKRRTSELFIVAMWRVKNDAGFA